MRAWLLVFLLGCADPAAVKDPADATEVVFEVPKGATGKKVGELLEQRGLIGSAWNWGLVLRNQDGGCIKAGKHSVRRNMSVNEILTTLCGAPIPDDVPFTVLEGWRIRDIDAALAAKGWITAGEYQSLATTKGVDLPFEIGSTTLEGYLYPETYMVPPDEARFDAARLIERQLATFQERFLVPHQAELGSRTLHEVVVVASMVEREEPTEAQRPVVAGIMWKRLDAGTPLGIDATSRYLLENWEDEKAFRAVLKDPADLYGTRVRTGLPPTAIGNPTLSSLLAALKPEQTEFWYYLHDSKGVFHGGKNAAEHEANRRQYGVW